MKEILLSQNLRATVDDIDFDWLSQWKWCAHKQHRGRNGCYAVRNVKDAKTGKFKTIQMHREILKRMGFLEFKHSDYINGDKLDNRRANLRPATPRQNALNQDFGRFPGVYQNGKRWIAQVKSAPGKTIHVGTFDTRELAAEARRVLLLDIYGITSRNCYAA